MLWLTSRYRTATVLFTSHTKCGMPYGITGGRTMGRALHRLSAVQIKTLAPGMHNDGHGLYLRVSDTGTRSWIFRFTLGGKTRDMGLGSTNVVSLAAARKRA